jgi:hypothetical protein
MDIPKTVIALLLVLLVGIAFYSGYVTKPSEAVKNQDVDGFWVGDLSGQIIGTFDGLWGESNFSGQVFNADFLGNTSVNGSLGIGNLHLTQGTISAMNMKGSFDSGSKKYSGFVQGHYEGISSGTISVKETKGVSGGIPSDYIWAIFTLIGLFILAKYGYLQQIFDLFSRGEKGGITEPEDKLYDKLIIRLSSKDSLGEKAEKGYETLYYPSNQNPQELWFYPRLGNGNHARIKYKGKKNGMDWWTKPTEGDIDITDYLQDQAICYKRETETNRARIEAAEKAKIEKRDYARYKKTESGEGLDNG